jgi:hypothetical protein
MSKEGGGVMGPIRRVAVFAAILLTAGIARAQCTSAIQSVSQQFVFPNHAAGPVASNGSVIVVAKSDPTDVLHALYLGAYTLDLAQIGADNKVADATLAGPVALVSAGNEIGLFYQTPAGQLTLQRIDAGGNPVGTPIAIAPQHVPTQNQEFGFTFDAVRNGYVIVHTITQGRDFGLWLTVINRDGSVQFDQAISFFPLGTGVKPRVISGTNGRLGIAWVREDDPNGGIYFQVADRANLPVVTLRLTAIQPRFGDLVLSTTPTDSFLLLFGAPPPPPQVVGPPQPASIIWSVTISQSGAASAASPFISGRDVDDVAPISLIRNPTLNENALLYSYARFGFANGTPDLRLRRFGPGLVPSDTILSPNSAISVFPTTWPLVWTGSSYVDSVIRPVGTPHTEGTDTYLIKHCPFLATMTADRSATLPFRDVRFTLTSSGGTAPFDFVWDFGDLTVGQHGTVLTHQYTRSGTYVVTASGTDAAGAHTTATFTVTVVDATIKPRTAKK